MSTLPLWGTLSGISLVAAFTLFMPWMRQQPRAALAGSITFCVCALLLYAWLGSPALPQQVEERQEALRTLAEKARVLSAQVEQNPEDAASWAHLGGTFFDAGQYDAAARAFKQATLRSGGDPQWILWYAKALTLAAGTVTDEARKGLEIVLQLDPENSEAAALLEAAKRPAN